MYPNKKRSIAYEKNLFLIGTTLFWMGLYVYVPVLSPYTEFLSHSFELVGLVVGSYGFTQLLLRFPLGIWSDRIGKRKPFVIWGFILIILSCVGMALSPNAWFLLIFRALSGVAASTWVAFTVLYSGYFRDDQSTRAMSIVTLCTGFGQAISAFGGKLADMYGWTAPFYAGAILSVFGLLFMLPIGEQPDQKKNSASLKSLLLVTSHKRLLIVSVITALSQFAIFSTTYGFLTIYAKDIGGSKSYLGLLMFTINIAQTISMILAGTVVAPRIGYKATVGIAYIVVAITTFTTTYVKDIWILLIIQSFGALLRGLAYPILMGLAIQGIPKEEKASAMGFFQAVYAIGMFLGPFISGFIGGASNLESIFFTSSAIYIIAAIIGIFALPKIEKQV
jgi:MFS family permease